MESNGNLYTLYAVLVVISIPSKIIVAYSLCTRILYGLQH